MIDYVDPIPPIVRFMQAGLNDLNVYGNTFPANATFPALLVRTAGGTDYTRIQLIARAERDYEAMQTLIKSMNHMERSIHFIADLKVKWCEKESLPIPDQDADSGAAEAWCYMRLEHAEA